MRIYVSNKGNDCWEGNQEHPVQSLEKAVSLARAAGKDCKEGRKVQ